MVQCLVQLGQHVVLDSRMVTVLCQPSVRHRTWGIVVLLYTDSYGEIVESSLKITHLVVALASQRECLRYLTIFVASLRELSKRLLNFFL